MAEEAAPARAAGTHGQTQRHRWVWPGLLGTMAVVAAVVGCSAVQRSLVYPAVHYDHAEFERRVAREFAGRAHIVAPLDALVIEPPGGAASPATTAIYFHGNGDVNTKLAMLVPVFMQHNMRLVLAEYPGYGARPGDPSEQTLISDGQALYAAVARGYPGAAIIVIGQSLGSGVAAQVAANIAPALAPVRLVLITPFLNLPEAAAHSVWGLPVQSMFSERYDSVAALARYAGPVALLVAGKDRLLGPEQGRQLARTERSRGVTVVVEVPEADHDSWPDLVKPADWDTLLGTPPAR